MDEKASCPALAFFGAGGLVEGIVDKARLPRFAGAVDERPGADMGNYLVPVLGETGAIVAQVIITILAVLALLGVVAWALRGYFGNRLLPGTGPRAPRLGVIDQVPIDAKRRLVLVRRDQFEHLLLVGGPTDIVVEETIYRGVPLANYPRNEGVRGPAPAQAVGGAPSAGALRGTAPAPGALAAAAGGEETDTPTLAQPTEPQPATAEPAPVAPRGSRREMPATGPAPERQAASPFPAAPAPVAPHSAIETHVEVPLGSVDRQSRAASFASRFQSGLSRGGFARRGTARDSAPEQPAAVAAGASDVAAVEAAWSAAMAARSEPEPEAPAANTAGNAEPATSDSDWITPAFADAMEPRQAIAANDPTASIDEPPVEEVLPPAPPAVEEQPPPPPPVEFAPRAARRANQANLEQEMARLLGEIASKRSR